MLAQSWACDYWIVRSLLFFLKWLDWPFARRCVRTKSHQHVWEFIPIQVWSKLFDYSIGGIWAESIRTFLSRAKSWGCCGRSSERSCLSWFFSVSTIWESSFVTLTSMTLAPTPVPQRARRCRFVYYPVKERCLSRSAQGRNHSALPRNHSTLDSYFIQYLYAKLKKSLNCLYLEMKRQHLFVLCWLYYSCIHKKALKPFVTNNFGNNVWWNDWSYFQSTTYHYCLRSVASRQTIRLFRHHFLNNVVARTRPLQQNRKSNNIQIAPSLNHKRLLPGWLEGHDLGRRC